MFKRLLLLQIPVESFDGSFFIRFELKLLISCNGGGVVLDDGLSYDFSCVMLLMYFGFNFLLYI